MVAQTDDRGYDLERIKACAERTLRWQGDGGGLDPDLVEILDALPSMLSDLKLLREARDSGALEYALFLVDAERTGGVRFQHETEADRFAAAISRLASGEP